MPRLPNWITSLTLVQIMTHQKLIVLTNTFKRNFLQFNRLCARIKLRIKLRNAYKYKICKRAFCLTSGVIYFFPQQIIKPLCKNDENDVARIIILYQLRFDSSFYLHWTQNRPNMFMTFSLVMDIWKTQQEQHSFASYLGVHLKSYYLMKSSHVNDKTALDV